MFLLVLAIFDVVVIVVVARARDEESTLTGVDFAAAGMVVSLLVSCVLLASISPLPGPDPHLRLGEWLVMAENAVVGGVGLFLSRSPWWASWARNFYGRWDPLSPALMTVPMALLTFFTLYSPLTSPVASAVAVDQEAALVARGVVKVVGVDTVPAQAQVFSALAQISSGNVTLSAVTSSGGVSAYTVSVARDSDQACLSFSSTGWVVASGACTGP